MVWLGNYFFWPLRCSRDGQQIGFRRGSTGAEIAELEYFTATSRTVPAGPGDQRPPGLVSPGPTVRRQKQLRLGRPDRHPSLSWASGPSPWQWPHRRTRNRRAGPGVCPQPRGWSVAAAAGRPRLAVTGLPFLEYSPPQPARDSTYALAGRGQPESPGD